MIVGPEYVTGSSRNEVGHRPEDDSNMISTALMVRLGRVDGNRMVNMQLTNDKLVDRGTRIARRCPAPRLRPRPRMLLAHGSVEKALHFAAHPPTNNNKGNTNHLPGL
jgi:N-acetylmuramic acid 6-phosphate etherase